MTTATLRRVFAEVRLAAQETPRLYFAGVKDMARLVGRLVAASQSPVTDSRPRRHAAASKRLAATPSSIRHSKKRRLR